MNRNAIHLLAVAIALSFLSACTKVEPKAEAVSAQRFLLDHGAYYVQNYEKQLIEGLPVKNGNFTIPSGAALGQTMHPTVEQLKAIGFLPPQWSGRGDVSIQFDPVDCNKSKVQPCNMKLIVGASDENVRLVPVKF